MRHAHLIRLPSRSDDGMFFSVALTGAIVAIVSALCAVDVAILRALFSLP